jgi:2-octaprenyl-6-methoxyphenol hydroxylase
LLSEYDIVIAGGGMVGASLACALANSQQSVAVVEAIPVDSNNQSGYDDRGLALSLSSQRIFRGLDIWQDLEPNASPIKRIHVSDKGHFGKVRMDAESMRLEALGFVVIARELGSVLQSRLQRLSNVDHLCPAKIETLQQSANQVSLSLSLPDKKAEISCKLLIVADGSNSGLRGQLGIKTELVDYAQTAIVTNITAELSHNDTAYERFTESGPVAFLPLKQNRCKVVFTVSGDQSEYYLSLSDEEFLQEIQLRFGRRLGRLSKVGKRISYPLKQVLAQQQLEGRALLLGNSAHTIHPNGAQGFNLCLRDVASLAETLSATITKDPGDRQLLESYIASRTSDQERVSGSTHALARWFYNKHIVKAACRNLAMTFIDLVPPAKLNLIRQGTGIWGRQAELVRGPIS